MVCGSKEENEETYIKKRGTQFYLVLCNLLKI